MIRSNPNGDYPRIRRSAYVDPSAVIIGAVVIGKNVYVGPGAVVRADEPRSAISIGDGCNIQDRVVVHALASTKVTVRANTSLAHGCIVHGPCEIGKNCFVGFGAVVFGAVLEDGVFVKHLAVIEGARLARGSVVPSRGVRRGAAASKAAADPAVFAQKVVAVNIELGRGYRAREGVHAGTPPPGPLRARRVSAAGKAY